jgi:hypothetical protein
MQAGSTAMGSLSDCRQSTRKEAQAQVCSVRQADLSNSIWHVIGTGTIGTGMVHAFELLIKLELLLLRLFVLGVSWGRP